MNKLFHIMAGTALISCSSAGYPQRTGESREIFLRTIERPTRNILKKVGNKTFSCIAKAVFRVSARQTYQCRATRKLPFCDAPGTARKYCPEVCSDGGWVNSSTREDYLREVVTDCNPIEDPFGGPTKRAQ